MVGGVGGGIAVDARVARVRVDIESFALQLSVSHFSLEFSTDGFFFKKDAADSKDSCWA